MKVRKRVRSKQEIIDLFNTDDTGAQAIIRGRDALQASTFLSDTEIAAVEDYLFAMCLAVGRTSRGDWKLSPVALYGMLLMTISFAELGEQVRNTMEELARRLQAGADWSQFGVVESHTDTEQPQE